MPTAGNLLCACGTFMHVHQNSVTVEELLSDGGPYKLWDADHFVCGQCGASAISNFAQLPLAEHWQPTYRAKRAHLAERGPIYPGRCRPETT